MKRSWATLAMIVDLLCSVSCATIIHKNDTSQETRQIKTLNSLLHKGYVTEEGIDEITTLTHWSYHLSHKWKRKLMLNHDFVMLCKNSWFWQTFVVTNFLFLLQIKWGGGKETSQRKCLNHPKLPARSNSRNLSSLALPWLSFYNCSERPCLITRKHFIPVGLPQIGRLYLSYTRLGLTTSLAWTFIRPRAPKPCIKHYRLLIF